MLERKLCEISFERRLTRGEKIMEEMRYDSRESLNFNEVISQKGRK